MIKTYKYRLYPTHRQKRVLKSHIEACRTLYNTFLHDRIHLYEDKGEQLSMYDQINNLPSLKKSCPLLAGVYSQVLQNVAMRVDLAFRGFFRRCKTGDKPGFPRYKGKDRYDSITYTQMGFAIKAKRLRLGKIGSIKINKHRPLEGKPKTCTILRSATGKWYATIDCEVDCSPLPKSNEKIGIDVGLDRFATLSNGKKIGNPRFFCRADKEISRSRRKVAKSEKGTKKNAKDTKAAARIHERIKFKRHDFAHKLARSLVNKYGLIAVEDLTINLMVRDNFLAKSIYDAAWSQFRHCLSYKAEEAGRILVAVNPAYTSQDCSECGYRLRKTLSQRRHRCPSCGLDIDRDENAARNILRLGLQSQPKHGQEAA